MSDSEVKTSETKTPAARKPRTKKTAAPAAVVADAPKVRKPRAKKEAAVTAAPAEAKVKAPAKPRKTAAKKTAKLKVTPEQRHDMVCTAAYFIAEKRGFMHGYDHDDWLAAEVQVDATIELI